MTGSTLRRRLRHVENSVYGRMLHPQAATAAEGEAAAWDAGALRGHKYCLVLTYRRDGTTVATPVWFGVEGGRVYFRTEAESGKVKRIRRDPAVRVAPCTNRGRPLGPAMAGSARVLGTDEEPAAERAIQANYGLARRLYEGLLGSRVAAVYVEVGSAAPGRG
jgi:PPOX class probable F420-dependent enzyme